MFKITRVPPVIASFFEPHRSRFHWDHFEYFQVLVVLIAFAWGRRNVSNLYRHLDERNFRHRSRFNNFFLVGRFDEQALLRETAYHLLAKLDPQPGEVIEFLIDDSKKGKRGKKMDAVSFVHDPLTGKVIRGHQYVCAAIRFRGHIIPWGIRLYVKKEDCRRLGVEFQKTTQIAAQLIGEFATPQGVRVRVLFDSFYFCPTVVKACRKKDFRFVTTLKGNRNLFKNGRKHKVRRFGRNLFHRGAKRSIVVGKENGEAHYAFADAGMLQVGNIGLCHVIFSRKNHDKKILGLVTDDEELSGEDIIKVYDVRWNIEVFFKDTKQLLGLGQYQNGAYRAAVIHLHLVCMSYALLTHIAIGEGAKGKKKTKKAAGVTIGKLQNDLRRMVWNDLVDHLKKMETGTAMIRELDHLLVAV